MENKYEQSCGLILIIWMQCLDKLTAYDGEIITYDAIGEKVVEKNSKIVEINAFSPNIKMHYK